MAKEIPYFRFYPGEWIMNNITTVSLEAQGLFINICCYYWTNNCSIRQAVVKQRFNESSTALNELVESGIIKLNKESENLSISFLNEQYEALLAEAEKRSIAGKKGGIASALKRSSTSRQAIVNESSTYKDKYKDKDKDNIVEQIISYLNFVSGKNFSATTAETIKHINGRIAEGRSVDELKAVIDRKCDQWLGDKKMDQFIRPNTLFNQSKFDSYLNESDELRAEGEDRPLTEDERYEQVKNSFFEYWNKTGNFKDAMDNYAGSPFIKKIYKEVKKAGLRKDQLTGKRPADVIPGYKEMVAKLQDG